jgi:NAD(P)-dependent dehydrogenase (short-subunit alcohol dehydrogenase family)
MSEPRSGRFDGRVAIVTGGAAGLGYATAAGYAAEGAAVVIVDIDEARLRSAAAQLGVDGVAADLAREADVDRVVAYVLEQHGRIDILVNLAGIYPMALIEDETFAGWKRLHEVNLDATFLTCRAVLPHMRARGYGRIVNTSSGTVNNGQPGFASYVATKAGVIGLSRVLSKEVGAAGVTVNVIMPGLIATDRVLHMLGDDAETQAFLADAVEHQSIKRNGRAEDIAHAILFLTEEASGWISGQTLQVDGGWSFT